VDQVSTLHIFAIIAVFAAGLMIGGFLSILKKDRDYQMRMSSLSFLLPGCYPALVSLR
jgi:K+-transporting ATPase A subunit